MASTGTEYTRNRGLLLGVAVAAAALFVLFVYGYPRLFPHIERSNRKYFEESASAALAAGDTARAAKIARNAVEQDPLNPMAYTTLGRILLAAGDQEEALSQLHKAVGIEHEIVDDSRVATRKPFYFRPARLTLAHYYAEQNRLPLAAVNFELARPHAQSADDEYTAAQATQYRVYAALGFWARALEFGEPSDAGLEGLAAGQLARLARVAEGKQDWKLVRRTAARLQSREETAAQAQYLLGRAYLAEGQFLQAASLFKEAAAKGYAGSAYFQGVALEKSGQPEQALQAYLAVKPDDVYYPFALAKALTILANYPEEKRAAAATISREVFDAFDAAVAGLRRQQPPLIYDTFRRFRPLAFARSEEYAATGGRFPLVILWQDGQSSEVSGAVSFQVAEAGDSLLVPLKENALLQLQWVENRVNWDGVEQAADGAEVPGWVDTARDWFGLRTEYAPGVERDGTGNAYLSLPKVTWLGSVPVPARQGAGYLVAGRVRGQAGGAGLTWQAYDAEGGVLFEDDIAAEGTTPDAWTWRAGYRASQLLWESLRVQLSVLPRAGAADFDDLMLVDVSEPDPGILK